MKQLCYTSFLVDGLDIDKAIADIMKVANEKNKKYGVTGLLVYSNEIFVQLLEGKAINVDITYRIIQEDPRHFNCQILFEQENSQRCYPEWSMKYQKTDEIDLNTVNKFLRIAEKIKKKEGMSNDQIREMFNELNA